MNRILNTINMKKYKNRDGDEYTFTLDNEGNILWQGSFQWVRTGSPNDYTNAYNSYRIDGGELNFEDFKKLLLDNYHNMAHPIRKYVSMVEAVLNRIDMVDPSGGPYITVGTNMGLFSDEFKDFIVGDIKRVDDGYKLIKQLEDEKSR
jgi:hypothetical protein